MTKLAPQEMKLLGATLLVVLAGGTWLWLGPSLDEWKQHAAKERELAERRAVAERLVASRPRVEEEMAEFLAGLPVYPAGKKAESTLLPALEALAGDLLTRREVGAEKPSAEARDLYETSVTCHWQGTLERLVKFLWEQQSQGVASDMRALSVQVGSTSGGGGKKEKGKLNGRFTIDYAYRRTAEGESAGGDGEAGGEE